jgi:hypothetical protein
MKRRCSRLLLYRYLTLLTKATPNLFIPRSTIRSIGPEEGAELKSSTGSFFTITLNISVEVELKSPLDFRSGPDDKPFEVNVAISSFKNVVLCMSH